MKTWIPQSLTLILFCIPFLSAAQENPAQVEKESYYEQRAREDAQYEQQLSLNEEEARDFWEDQEQYEAELKNRDRKAYKAYMKGKRDAYAEHYRQCGNHCGHGPQYYSQAHFYYSRYYYPRPSRTWRTGIRTDLPDIRLGVGVF